MRQTRDQHLNLKNFLRVTMKTILTTQQIINTYDARQQDLCRVYFDYKKVKLENPTFGYKRIARLLGYKYGKTRLWHEGKNPVPIDTVTFLEERGLLPLNEDHPKLPLIAKVLGATLGDGGVYATLNAIFLSSAQLDMVKEFGEDLREIFGEVVMENKRIAEGGEYGHSWRFECTNRNVIRFFVALGAPVGDKSFLELIVPAWIKESKERIKDEFFGSFFGNELGVPKVHIEKNRLDLFSLGITGSEELGQNRDDFLKEIAVYLAEKGIVTGTISINDHKKENRKGEPTKVYRLLMSTKFENMLNFMSLTKINYCKYKKEKLGKTMNEFAEIKRGRLENFYLMGYSEERSRGLLKLTPADLEVIENYEDFSKIYEEELGSDLIAVGIEY